MKRILSLAAALFVLSGCSLDVEPSTSTLESETVPSESTSITEEAPHPTLPAAEDSTENIGVDHPQEEVIGFTEAPSAAQPSPMEKTIESCGDVSLHETGTTFFSDGTSGWTQQCADEMLAANPPVQEAAAVYEAPAVQQMRLPSFSGHPICTDLVSVREDVHCESTAQEVHAGVPA